MNFTASVVGAGNLVVDVERVRQTIDGMGVNINVNSWKNGELKPALDALININGSSAFRVIRDPMTWVNSESLIPRLHSLDLPTLQLVYETPAMQDIWNTIGYLNQKGIPGKQIILNFMGWTPTWLGGSGTYGRPSHITVGKEQSFATMVASLVYYGRVIKGLNFTYLSPLNEEDWDCKEGPCAGTRQYALIMRDLAMELNGMGVNDIRFIAPDTAGDPSGYIESIKGDSTVFSMTDHLTFHAYGGSRHPGALYGFWGLLAYDEASGVYSPRKRFYVNSQINRFVTPGSQTLFLTNSVSGLGHVGAFYNPATHKVAIVGHNTASSPVTVNGRPDQQSTRGRQFDESLRDQPKRGFSAGRSRSR